MLFSYVPFGVTVMVMVLDCPDYLQCDWIKHAKPALFNAKAMKDCYSANSEIMLGFFMIAHIQGPHSTLYRQDSSCCWLAWKGKRQFYTMRTQFVNTM